jgi:hypothetical protein
LRLGMPDHSTQCLKQFACLRNLARLRELVIQRLNRRADCLRRRA